MITTDNNININNNITNKMKLSRKHLKLFFLFIFSYSFLLSNEISLSLIQFHIFCWSFWFCCLRCCCCCCCWCVGVCFVLLVLSSIWSLNSVGDSLMLCCCLHFDSFTCHLFLLILNEFIAFGMLNSINMMLKMLLAKTKSQTQTNIKIDSNQMQSKPLQPQTILIDASNSTVSSDFLCSKITFHFITLTATTTKIGCCVLLNDYFN